MGIIIYIIWDINGGIFDIIFSLLGTNSIIGAKSGSIWEYYFRTSLDHWSSYLGMIFALNYPLVDQLYNITRENGNGYALHFITILMLGITIWWLLSIYTLPKLQYNLI